jgi:hypothetical protein
VKRYTFAQWVDILFVYGSLFFVGGWLFMVVMIVNS